MNSLVQLLVWTTSAVFLYLAWLGRLSVSPIDAVRRSQQTRRIFYSLQTLWLVIGLSVLVTWLTLNLAEITQSIGALTFPCPIGDAAGPGPHTFAYLSTARVCAKTGGHPGDEYPASQNGLPAAAPHARSSAASVNGGSRPARLGAESLRSNLSAEAPGPVSAQSL